MGGKVLKKKKENRKYVFTWVSEDMRIHRFTTFKKIKTTTTKKKNRKTKTRKSFLFFLLTADGFSALERTEVGVRFTNNREAGH